MGFSVLGFSVPVFVTGYLLIWAFAIKLGWFNVQGYTPLANGFWLFLHRLIPARPGAVHGLRGADRAHHAHQRHRGHGRGLHPHRPLQGPDRDRRAGPRAAHAAVPIATVVGVGVALLISGVVVTESVFNIPGLGRLVVEAVLARDYPVIQGLTLFFAFVYVFINLVVDCAYTVFDPRIRY